MVNTALTQPPGLIRSPRSTEDKWNKGQHIETTHEGWGGVTGWGQ